MEEKEGTMREWYLEYLIHDHRPGLLGDISSLLGMLQINILSINGVDHNRRGMLIESVDDERIHLLRRLLEQVPNISITELRPPQLRDRLAVRHGRYISREGDDQKKFCFVRQEIGMLVDFLAAIFNNKGRQLIGVRGRPRVGKTESIIASSVCANKRWIFISSTLLKQTVRHELTSEELSSENLFIIDGVVSTLRADEQHQMLLREVLSLEATIVIEHPDVFVRYTEYSLDDFSCIIELRNYDGEEIPIDIDPLSSTF